MSKSTVIYAIVCACLVWCVMDSPAFAVTVETLKEPIKDFKKELFGGWMGLLKIGAPVAGLALSLFRFSPGPLAMGVGVGVGIVFFDKYLGDGATGALI